MTPEKKKFTKELKCGHCENEAPMEIVGESPQLEAMPDNWDLWWGWVYQLAKCPACSEITVLRCFVDPDFHYYTKIETLYPYRQRLLLGLPDDLLDGHREAMRVRSLSANSYGVMLSRVLDKICDDQGAKKGDLFDRLEELEKKGKIPDKILGVAHSLREFSNVGRHPQLGTLTEAEVPLLDNLYKALVWYVYTAPHLERLAKQRLKEVKEAKEPQEPRQEEKAEEEQ